MCHISQTWHEFLQNPLILVKYHSKEMPLWEEKRGSCKILTIKQRFWKVMGLWWSLGEGRLVTAVTKEANSRWYFWALLGIALSSLLFTTDFKQKQPKARFLGSTNLNAFITLPFPISCYFTFPQEWYANINERRGGPILNGKWAVSCSHNEGGQRPVKSFHQKIHTIKTSADLWYTVHCFIINIHSEHSISGHFVTWCWILTALCLDLRVIKDKGAGGQSCSTEISQRNMGDQQGDLLFTWTVLKPSTGLSMTKR